jgi:hypothetical protein
MKRQAFLGSTLELFGKFDGWYSGSILSFSFTVSCSAEPSGITRLAPKGIRHFSFFAIGS